MGGTVDHAHDHANCTDPFHPLQNPTRASATNSCTTSKVLVILPWSSFGLQQDASVYHSALSGCAMVIRADKVTPPPDAADAVRLFLEHSPMENITCTYLLTYLRQTRKRHTSRGEIK